MLVALDIRTEQVDTVNEVLPGIALPGRDQLPKRVQKVYDCDIVLSQGAGTFVPEEGMSWTVRDFLSCLKPALTEREADVLVFSRTLLNLVNMGSFPYRLADSKLTVSIGELVCTANPDIILETLEDPQDHLGPICCVFELKSAKRRHTGSEQLIGEMVAAAQWNIRTTPEVDVAEQRIWGIKCSGESFYLYYLVLSREFQLSLKLGRSPPQAVCKIYPCMPLSFNSVTGRREILQTLCACHQVWRDNK
eukprot:TRINITY_DN870_c0_g1_i10.p1 TRINITY_DN870_c0_g1~~TRINITY_DN870_c0_g1_i10.p1  ORF type:complete len:249 (-),score=21.28 TRINITY_DN870_c0_g1_i10:65-811(-)